jgi:hypothetical protein
MKFKSERSELELRENQLYSINKSYLRGENTQTIDFKKINKIEIFKWKMGQLVFYIFGFTFLSIGFNRGESIGGGLYLIHQNDDWYIKNIILGVIMMIVCIALGILFNSKYGKNVSVYVKYYMGSKLIMRSIYTSKDKNEINNIVSEIRNRQ